MALKPIDPAPQYPSGGMSDEDIGDQVVQKPALSAESHSGNKDADGEQKGPEGDGGVGMFGNGPPVRQSYEAPKSDGSCAPGKGEGGY